MQHNTINNRNGTATHEQKRKKEENKQGPDNNTDKDRFREKTCRTRRALPMAGRALNEPLS